MHVRTLLLRTVLSLLTAAALLYAHGGGLDAQGGHNDRKNGGYHFHRGPLAGRSFPSKSAAGEALRSSRAGADKSTAKAKSKDSESSSAAASGKDSSSTGFKCGEKRTCGQMSSCAEARFYLNECGLNRLDGDNDGTPCESLCR